MALYMKYKESDKVSLNYNFLAEWTNPGLTPDYIQWSWMA